MRIGELLAKSGFTTSAIRFHEPGGLPRAAARAGDGHLREPAGAPDPAAEVDGIAAL